MKKIILCLLLLLAPIFISGCSESAGVGLIKNADGTIVEYYYIPFYEEDMIATGLVTKNQTEQIKANIKVAMNNQFNEYLNKYKQKINSSTDYTETEKEKLLTSITISENIVVGIPPYLQSQNAKNIIYRLNFENTTSYLEFKNANEIIAEPKEVITINNFFTITTKVVKDPLFDNLVNGSLTLAQRCVELAEEQMQNVIGENKWNELKEEINFTTRSQTFDYVYIVPSARYHSNANSIIEQDGYYYHTWTFNINNNKLQSPLDIQYWTTQANRPVWYFTIIGISAIVVVGVYIAGKRKESKNNKKLEQNSQNLDKND